MKIGEVARRLGVTTDIARYAANSYGDHMSASAGGQIKGAKRQFSERDCQVIATVLKMREQGLAPEQIATALKTANLEPCPDLPSPAEEAARESVALVAQPEYDRALDKLAGLQQDLIAAKAERDKALQTWQADTNRLNDKVADLEHQLGKAEGELIAIREAYKPAAYWLRLMALGIAAAVAVTIILAVVLTLAAR